MKLLAIFFMFLAVTVQGCGLNLYEGTSDTSKLSPEEKANKALSNNNAQEAVYLLEDTLPDEVLDYLLKEDPLGESYSKTLARMITNLSLVSKLTMLANAYGARESLDFLTFVSRIADLNKREFGTDRDKVTSLFPLLPSPTLESIANLDKGVSIIEAIKIDSKNALTRDQLTIEAVLGVSAFAGSLRLLDGNRDSKLSSSEIQMLDLVQGARIYDRLYRTRKILDNVIENAYTEKLESADRKINTYIYQIETAPTSKSTDLEAIKTEKVQFFLRKHMI